MVAALPIAIGAGLAAGGIAGALGGGSTPSFDPSQLLNTINQSKARQNQIASSLPGQLQPLGTQFQTGITGAETTAQTAEQAAAQKFLKDSGQAIDSQGQQLSDILKQRVLGAQPAEQEALNESLAASGGLQRGGANAAKLNLAQTNAQQIGQGEQQIALQQNQQRQQNLQTVLGMDNNFIQQRLGIDKDTLTQLYASGRQDLIDEANQLLGIEQTTTGQTLDVQAAAQNAQLAEAAAANQRQQQLYQALTGLGGTIAGYGLTPSAAPAKTA